MQRVKEQLLKFHGEWGRAFLRDYWKVLHYAKTRNGECPLHQDDDCLLEEAFVFRDTKEGQAYWARRAGLC